MRLPSDFRYGYRDCEPYTEYETHGLIHYYEFGKRKDGKQRRRPSCEYYASFTFLKKCRFCGLLSTPKKIQVRNFFGGERPLERRRGEDTWIQAQCCVGCWSKIRRLSEAHFQCRDNRTMINKIRTEIREHSTRDSEEKNNA